MDRNNMVKALAYNHLARDITMSIRTLADQAAIGAGGLTFGERELLELTFSEIADDLARKARELRQVHITQRQT